MSHPLTVTCPRCKAAPGKFCRTPLGHLLRPEDDDMHASHRERRRAVGDTRLGRKRMDDDATVYRTKTGKILTEADIEALAAEAERGYDVSHLRKPHYAQPTRERLPKKLAHKVRCHSHVWCDAHGEIHDAGGDPYGDHPDDCKPYNWRRVYIESDDRTETF